jgi:hypothetical protein
MFDSDGNIQCTCAGRLPADNCRGYSTLVIGAVDWHIIGSLLAGSLPGIVLCSYVAVWIPEAALRLVPAVTLIVVASKLATIT